MDEKRAKEGLEHLQAAAREMIAATRALLDVAEELVDDPATASFLLDTLRSAAGAAGRAASWAQHGTEPGGPADGDDHGPRVERIRVS